MFYAFKPACVLDIALLFAQNPPTQPGPQDPKPESREGLGIDSGSQKKRALQEERQLEYQEFLKQQVNSTLSRDGLYSP